MKEADEEVDPGTIGYMPRVSHDRAMALLRQVGTYLALTSSALADPTGDRGQGLPIALQQFAYNHHSGKGELLTHFRSAPDFEKCQDDD